MNAVTVQEVVEALRELAEHEEAWHLHHAESHTLRLIKRIEQHGIAPPYGMVVVPIEPTDAMQTAHDMYGDTSDWWNAVISAVIRAAAPEVKP